jgi:hypothetical protein
MDSFNAKHIDSNDANSTVVVVKKGDTATPHMLAAITINKTSAHALEIYDGEDNTGDLIAILKASIAEGTYEYFVSSNKGIAIVVPSGYVGDATISYK